MLMERPIAYRPLRAPREPGQVLIDPPAATLGAMIARNEALRAAVDYDLQGQPLKRLAADARRDLLTLASDYTRRYRDVDLGGAERDANPRIFLSGHQPQLFHPGVWFKNFFLGALARQRRAVGVNLVIDSDAIKTVSIRVPTGMAARPRVETVLFDRPSAEIPFEERSILDREVFRTFGRRVQETLAPLVAQPLIEQLWPLAVERSSATSNLGLCLAQARHRLEGAWGLQTLEAPQSALCRLPAFHWFTAHLLAQAPRFWEIYNRALAEYRAVHHLRSKAHPAPDLAHDGVWLEAPFWIWNSGDPLRRRAFVRQRGDQIWLTDRQGVEIALDLTPDGAAERAVEQLAALEGQGVKLRTRALMTTLFARLMLGDLFLHGIGGAKYDQLTDQLLQHFFEIEPPGYATVTATFHLPISAAPAEGHASRRLDPSLRELTYHPERHLRWDELTPADRAAAEQWRRQKSAAIGLAKTPQNAHARHVAIVAANQALQPYVASLRAAEQAAQAAQEVQRRGQAILASREYAFCLFPESCLRTPLQDLSYTATK